MAEGRRIGLLGWILISLVVGVPFGIFFKDASISLSWMGDLFIRLLKMLIVPLVFFSLVTGTASISDPIKLGRVGVKIMALYLATTAIAVTIGLIVAFILNPAAGMKLAPVAGFTAPTVPALKEVLLNLIPTNPFDSLAKGDILPVIAFAIYFGVAAALAGDKGKAIVGAIEAAGEAMYKLTTIIMWYAPLGVFSLIATTVAKQGPQVLLPFKMGAGGVVGTGRQWLSWISLADATAGIEYAIGAAGLSGPVNLTAPQPVPNAEFARTLGKILGRPTLVPVPAFAVSLLLGEMGDELLLSGQKVLPKKLLAAGFSFAHPDLESAIRWALAH